MSDRSTPTTTPAFDREYSILSAGQTQFEPNLKKRHRWGRLWASIFLASTIVGIIALTVLIFTIINQSLGFAAIIYKRDPASLAPPGKTLETLTCPELLPIVEQYVNRNRLRVLKAQKPFDQLSDAECYQMVIAEVAQPTAKETWFLLDSLRRSDEIREYVAKKYPAGELVFKTWLNRNFLTTTMSDNPLVAGIRTGILGSLFVILIVIVTAFPTGIAAAIYLEEYARENRINRIIQTNINNLAGVPSVIYGMLGLAFFVRALEPLTSGAVLGFSDPATANGRTILSAGLTLALLILPVVIINSQEAIKAVPSSLREASYGMGATRWQTIWHHVLPNALPGILTGTILSVSRAFGETAPLVIVGASTYITTDPSSVFSKFTTLPIQVYQWTARPQDAYKNIAAAAILVLLALLLTLNATAILLRNRYSRRLA